MRILADKQPFEAGIALRMFDRKNGDLYVANPITLTHVQLGGVTDPTATIGITDAQELMDSLWHCGLRPSEGSGSAGALSATQKHLEDMRTLVFKTKGD